ncbi:MAG: BCCT family transporter [Oligoflexales bacterium]|nr:BCCT family transporter [Oligoflexales bacterium]
MVQMSKVVAQSKISKPVFLGSAGFVIICTVFAAWSGTELAPIAQNAQNTLSHIFGWSYTLLIALLLPFVLWLGLGRFSNVKLGPDEAHPDFSFRSWLSMLFAAGMGIGLMFYSVAEPILHFNFPTVGDPRTIAAAKQAMNICFVHWGLNAWAIYAIVGLSLAYFSFRLKLPLTMRSMLWPLLGTRIYGWIGNVVDASAVIASVFGVATSLALGTMQVTTGLHQLFQVPESIFTHILFISGVASLTVLSIVAGLERGIRWIAGMNSFLGLTLVGFVLSVGPTLFILRGTIESLGYYLQHLPETMFWTDTYRSTAWQNKWTVFYWAWWITWAPFVGMFIARISRGRTLREFVLGVLVVPSLLTLFWFSVFGHTALWIELFGSGGLSEAVQNNTATALFLMLKQFPWSALSSLLSMFVVLTFFITSSNSGALVAAMLSTSGNPTPPLWQRVFWTLAQGTVAAILLACGGISALQAGSVCAALPLSLLLVFVCIGMVKELYRSHVSPELMVDYSAGK